MNKFAIAIFLFMSMVGMGLAQTPGESGGQGPVDDAAAQQKKAQDKAQVDAARAQAGCGPTNVEFDVKTDKSQHPIAQLEAGKAVVYVFEEEKRQENTTYFGSVTTRVGLDGKWVGANHGHSYFFFFVDPGEHHLCAQWQSSFERSSRLGSALTFTAAPSGKYYFRTEVEERKEFPAAVRLKPVDEAEGQFLVSNGALSTSHPKKPVQAAQRDEQQ